MLTGTTNREGTDLMPKRILLTLAAIGLLALLGGFASLAVFTSTASVGGNTFSTDTVVISTSPTSALVTFSNMAPGDTTTQSLVVTNAGTLALRYAVSSTTTENTLAAQLDLTIRGIDVTTPGVPCDNFDGAVLYGPGDLGNTTAVNVIGSPTQGSQAGDRALASAASETLCFRVNLPLATGNTFQTLTTTATFAFQAEQTVNNP